MAVLGRGAEGGLVEVEDGVVNSMLQVFVCLCLWLGHCRCVCVRERETETERDRERQRDSVRDRETETENLPGCLPAYQSACVRVCLLARGHGVMMTETHGTGRLLHLCKGPCAPGRRKKQDERAGAAGGGGGEGGGDCCQ